MLSEDFLGADDDRNRKMQQKLIATANLGLSWIMTFAMVKQQKIMALQEILQGIHLIIHRLEAICLRRKAGSTGSWLLFSPKSFANKSVWASCSYVTGPIFNFILAFVCSVCNYCYRL